MNCRLPPAPFRIGVFTWMLLLQRLRRRLDVRRRTTLAKGHTAGGGAVETARFALLALALTTPGVHAASGKVQTVEQLRTALREDRFVPRAFIKGDQIRLYFTNAEQCLMFKADWDRARHQVQGFSSHLAQLKFDASPPALPGPKQKWREPKVLAYADWQRFAQSAVTSLAPSEAGHGVYLQYALGDAVVFRDAAGAIKVEAFAQVPAGITIDRRLSRAEATATVASVVETNLHVAYAGESAFLLAPPAETQRSRLALLDLAERRVVVLLTPRIGDDPRGGPRVGGKISGLASFVIVDNAWAILKNPVSSTARVLNLGLQWPASLFGPRLRTRASAIPSLTSAPGMDLAAWEQWLDKHTGTVRERGSLRLLINGERFFPVFEERLTQAASSIDIHVCIFDRDDVAVQIADRLKERSTNTPVRVIFDHNSTRASGKSPPATPMPEGFVPPKSIRRYLTAGSQVHVRPFLNPFMTSDHSKVFLIDGRYAYIGGMNLGREYRYEWHDMMVEIEGPVVASLQHEFNKNWAHAGALGDLAFAERAVCGKRPLAAETNRSDFIDLRRIYTKTGRRQIRRAELESIARAKNHVFLENPYLYDNAVIVALVRARLRGVDVRVVLPSENDIGAGEGSNLVTANYLLKHGVRVYLYPGMTHVKAMLADGWACFGSANFNTLSLRLNQEADLATSDPQFVARFKHEMFETDFEKSSELKEPVSVDWSDHLADSILNLL
jgi:cardiolipin synthase A/B